MPFPNRRKRCSWQSLLVLVLLEVTAACHAEQHPRLVTAQPTSSRIETSWFEPKLPRLGSEAPAIDLSELNRSAAGEGGFVTVQGGHFRDGLGQRLRIFGVNLSGASCFPAADDAVRWARLLRRWGLNAVRFQALDAGPPPRGFLAQSGVGLDPGALDRLDRFVAELKSQGLYSVIVIKTLGYPSLPPELERRYPGGRVLDRFDPKLLTELRERARVIMQH
ncbi:MAG TPA: hypothetical protein VGP93_11155, partial [Polyangiaceae bacterium]|nr:hypothetical protein [Polyangiaceae bacterium]